MEKPTEVRIFTHPFIGSPNIDVRGAKDTEEP